ncbi:hypothetical protein SAMN05192561_1126 [Halopenitus malekzadehii]|uniref:Uncharacterized protein n=1 Tax=Halopenitus malekzadehii TaxID=1267564 RepID=A0A1H6JJ56_9EURY|nr:hypothetical protein [Halopenitus malekzadehii]SEH60484.1 hypothetical protein SAMN05192561_1126 [Halopenitus malekzadehii]
MLTTAEEDRFEAVLPESVDVSYDANQHTYELTVFWGGGNATQDYPIVILEWDAQNQPQTQRQPVDDVHRIDNPIDEPGGAEIRTSEVADELSITVAVKAVRGTDGVPPQTRCKQLVRRLWRFLDDGIDLNSEGPNGERPMRVEIASNPSPGRVDDTYRIEWSVQFHHAERYTEEFDTTESAEYAADQTDN